MVSTENDQANIIVQYFAFKVETQISHFTLGIYEYFSKMTYTQAIIKSDLKKATYFLQMLVNGYYRKCSSKFISVTILMLIYF